MVVKNLVDPTQVMNTGKTANPLFAGLVVSGILVPYNWTFAVAVTDSFATILANLETALAAALLHITPTSRAFYVGPFDAFNDKSEATTYQTLGYGKKVKTQRQIISKEYQVVDGGVEYWRALQSFTGKIDQYKWLEIDNQGVIYGTQTLDPTTLAVTGMQGIQLSSLEPQDRKQANKSTIEEHMLMLSFQNSGEVNESLYSIQTGIELDGFVNDLAIQDVTWTATGLMIAKVVSFMVTAGDGSINLGTALPLLLVTGNITLTNVETGSTAITITSLSINPTTGLATLTLSGAGAGWVPGNHMTIKLKDVTTLSTAGFKYYESNAASVVMVA